MDEIKAGDVKTGVAGQPIVPSEQKVVQTPPVPTKEYETKTPDQKGVANSQ